MNNNIIEVFDTFLNKNSDAESFFVTGLGFNYSTLFTVNERTTGESFIKNMENCGIDNIKSVESHDDNYALIVTDNKDRDYLVLNSVIITSKA